MASNADSKCPPQQSGVFAMKFPSLLDIISKTQASDQLIIHRFRLPFDEIGSIRQYLFIGLEL
jgi:hypothetical protein